MAKAKRTPIEFIPSASAIELHKLCEARALGKYVEGIREEQSAAAAEGTRLHKLTQDYLVTGKLPPMHEAAVHRIVAAIPVPGGSIRPHNIERVIVMPEVHGYMDWSDDVTSRQGDLKFTSNVRYQREKDPKTDTQRILYARDEFYRDPYLVTLRQTWSVSQFNGQAALQLDHKWTRKAVAKSFSKYVAPSLDSLVEGVQVSRDWRDAPKNYEACNAFNKPCPMLEHGCKRSIRNRLTHIRPKVKV